ncbi:protein of unknown function [Reichenbachiella faecimaris]|uniref:DUF4249 domain-containing protein n=1 Tax=Reichenbachiella faecimaris TaxID=692418 RepID=A0A1W2GKN6_REIFA|nr:DUF4249 domain-containing protein [Reichenbachiella faecimaris]SMD36908.1 protein of unknown function [Reichenbachiella faecimaris]
MKKSWHVLILSLIHVECVDEIKVPLSSETALVIHGWITNEPKTHQVQIALSYPFDENPLFKTIDPIVQKAQVDISDDESNIVQLIEGKNGNYYTPNNFAGIIGRVYTLHVVLNDGREYYSRPEKLLPNGATIDNVCFENTYSESLSSNNGSIVKSPEVSFSITFTDNSETKDYYRWGYKGVYEVFAPYAEIIKVPDDCDPTCGICPDETIKTCWATAFDLEFLKLDDDLLFNGRTVEDYFIYSTPADRRFNIGYAANIEQFSLTKTAFEYWSSIQSQNENTGTVFESPNFQIRGNIVSNENPDETVLGYFGASAMTNARVILEDVDVPGNLGPINCERSCIPLECIDCRYWPATNIKPDYWPN